MNIADTYIRLMKMSNFVFDKLAVVKSEFVKLFLLFFDLKKVILPNYAHFLKLANAFL